MKYLKSLPVYIALAAFIGFFAQAPIYHHAPADKAMIKLTLSHYGDRAEACRKLSAKEIAELPMNMKRTQLCSRKRIPIYVELLDGENVLYSAAVPPSGFGDDGPAIVYEKYWVDTGDHALTVRIRDSARPSGFDWTHEQNVTLTEHQHLIVDFRDKEGIWIRE